MPQRTELAQDIRLLVVDIDGTIAGPSNQVSPAVVEAIQAVQAQGIPVAVATGRMYRSAVRFHQQIQSTLPLIAYQGAWIQDPGNGQLHHHIPLDGALAQELLDYFEQHPATADVSVHLYLDDELYIQASHAGTDEYVARSSVKPITVENLRDLVGRSPTKLLAMSDDTALIGAMLGELKQRYQANEMYLTTSVDRFLEAANPKVNKGMAVQYLAESVMGLMASQVMAIGDNCNDLEMLEYAGLGIAMGDAPEVVKDKAQWVAPTVEADGVAVAIKRFLR
jgi:Cof subfamily protein (haloacid dehalogenase superfamily)